MLSERSKYIIEQAFLNDRHTRKKMSFNNPALEENPRTRGAA